MLLSRQQHAFSKPIVAGAKVLGKAGSLLLLRWLYCGCLRLLDGVNMHVVHKPPSEYFPNLLDDMGVFHVPGAN